MKDNQIIAPPAPFMPPGTGKTITCGNIQYFIGQQIGQGAFSTVFDCADEWGNQLAAKVLLPQNRPYEVVRKEWLHELQNL